MRRGEEFAPPVCSTILQDKTVLEWKLWGCFGRFLFSPHVRDLLYDAITLINVNTPCRTGISCTCKGRAWYSRARYEFSVFWADIFGSVGWPWCMHALIKCLLVAINCNNLVLACLVHAL